MANISRNFTKGRMNKSLDDRLIPDGEYIDALNIRLGSSELSDIGAIENTKGNSLIAQLSYQDTPLSSQAKCIKAFADTTRDSIYWFVHDPNFPIGDTGKLDLIVSFNEKSNVLTYHVISMDDGSGVNTVLNFNPTYLVNGVSLIDDLLFFTDAYNQPRKINVTRSYPSPEANIDQITEEDLLVIRKPPIDPPALRLLNTDNSDNFLRDRFICFAYRYRYDDNEYSATSEFSAPAFQPNFFSFDPSSYLNTGMLNAINAVELSYNSGSRLVRGIDLLFKEADSPIIKIIDSINKEELGLNDDDIYTYVFDNSKIYTLLPDSEILRIYDNVPVKAVAQTILGNRLMYSNYTEGYDLLDLSGNPVKLNYYTELVEDSIGIFALSSSLSSGNYLINGALSVPDSVFYIDLTGVELSVNSSIYITIRYEHHSFSGDLPYPTPPTADSISPVSFAFFLTESYASVYDLANSNQFKEKIGTILNIQPMSTSCDGNTFTDLFNCSVPSTLSPLVKFDSGIQTPGQEITIISSPSSSQIGFQIPAAVFVDNATTPTQYVYEYYSVSEVFAAIKNAPSLASLHSNRGYETFIVYIDEYGRQSSPLSSQYNTVNVPCKNSINKNSIKVTIPTTQQAPYWAKRYKFAIKSDRDTYETIYSNTFFTDPNNQYAYFLLEGENARKVQEGDELLVKADANGAIRSCVSTTVLSKESQPENFISIPGTYVPKGVYIKVKPEGFSAIRTTESSYDPGGITAQNTAIYGYPIVQYPCNIYNVTTQSYVDYEIAQGSTVVIKFRMTNNGPLQTFDVSQPGYGDAYFYEFSKTYISGGNYASVKEWWDGDGIQYTLNTGIVFPSQPCPTFNFSYDSTLGSVTGSPCAFNFRFDRLLDNRLVLNISGYEDTYGYIGCSFMTFSLVTTSARESIIFETKPIDSQPGIVYLSSESFGIDASGNHYGNVQNQNISLGLPAIINTDFFNCYSFGNGAESYKIKDSAVGKQFNIGNRVSVITIQDYRQINRFADITYSGVFNNESGVNKLNEFNLGLLNYKPLEQSFGPVYVLDGRETDILVLQEDRISYVLAGKNLLSDAGAGSALTSIPEVLGTQIARTEKYGISSNPESYVNWGADRFFTDVKRGAVIQLKAASARASGYSSDQLAVISNMGMRSWFRDVFHENSDTQKLGGFDPYTNEYVLSTNNILLPFEEQCDECGIKKTIYVEDTDPVVYCVDTGVLIGNFLVSYNVLNYDSPVVISISYNSVSYYYPNLISSGSFLIPKSIPFNDSAIVNISTASGNALVEVTIGCVKGQALNVVNVCLTNDYQSGQFIHNEYRYSVLGINKPVQSSLVEFATGTSTPLVSQYSISTGAVGLSQFPSPSSSVRMYSNKFGFDNFVFDPLVHKFRYLRTNTVYGNNSVDIQALVAASSVASPIDVTSAPSTYFADFTMPTTGAYLYMIWDYRDVTESSFCYSNTGVNDSCCGCGI